MSITKGKNGKFRAIVYYRDIFNKPRQKTSKWFERKIDALEAERNIKKDLENPGLKKTFKEMALEYIESVKDRNTDKSLADKRQMLRNYLAPLAHMPIDSITPLAIKAIFQQERFLQLGASRKNRIRGFLFSIFKYAMKMYNLQTNPVEAFPTFQDTEVKPEKVVYKPKEVFQVLDCIDREHEEYKAFLTLLYYSGARLNELRSLTFNDVQGNSIHIWRQYVNGKWQTLKNESSRRYVKLPKKAMEIISKQRDRYPQGGFIFGGEKPLHPNTIRRQYQKAQERAGLAPSRLHDLRHAHASFLIEHSKKEDDIMKVSKRLGHSSISTTLEIYAHLLDQDEDEFLEALESADMT